MDTGAQRNWQRERGRSDGEGPPRPLRGSSEGPWETDARNVSAASLRTAAVANLEVQGFLSEMALKRVGSNVLGVMRGNSQHGWVRRHQTLRNVTWATWPC